MSDTADDFRTAFKEWKTQLEKLGLAELTGDDLVEGIGRHLWGIGVDSKNRAERMLSLTWLADEEVFWRVFHGYWSGCDDTWYLREHLLNIMPNITDAASEYWSEEQRRFFDDLPEMVTLYRGCSVDRVLGISWTTDRKVAEGFARGHRGIRVPDAVIAQARISKRDIITVLTDREESEVIIDPDQWGFEASFERYKPMQEAA